MTTKTFSQSFVDSPFLTTFFLIFFTALWACMFNYSLYSISGKDISFWGDFSITCLITFFLRIQLTEKRAISLGEIAITWSFLLCFITRYFFAVEAPFWRF